jgi:hypothetical protein
LSHLLFDSLVIIISMFSNLITIGSTLSSVILLRLMFLVSIFSSGNAGVQWLEFERVRHRDKGVVLFEPD